MLFRTLLTASLLGSLLPLASHAQTAPAASRFYIGVGANLRTNVPFKDIGTVPRIVGPAITAGLQLTPRLAVQTGFSYHQKTGHLDYQYIAPQPADSYTNSNSYTGRYYLVPVLLRYTVISPVQRLHFDALGGGTFIHATGHSTSDYSFAPYHEERDDVNNWTNLTLGPGVRYAVSPHIELTASGLVSAVMGHDYYRFSDRLSLNVAAGVNYTFGQR